MQPRMTRKGLTADFADECRLAGGCYGRKRSEQRPVTAFLSSFTPLPSVKNYDSQRSTPINRERAFNIQLTINHRWKRIKTISQISPRFRHRNCGVLLPMAGRRRDNDWLAPIVAFVGLAVLAIVFIPDFRPILFAVGIIALSAFAVVAFGSFAIDLCRRQATGDKVSTTEGRGILTARTPSREEFPPVACLKTDGSGTSDGASGFNPDES